MLTSVQIIETICKPLSDSPSLSKYVQIAEDSLNRGFYGKRFEYAVAYKACHLFTLCDDGSFNKIKDLGNGSIQSYSEGGMSVSFSGSSGNSELESTKYGKMLLDLNRSIPTMNVNKNPLGSLMGGC